MNEPITRRDFLNGALIGGAGLLPNGQLPATISPADAFDGYGGVGDYRHSNGNRPHGRIAFANTDLAGAMDHRNSIREADRAVKQLLGV